MFLEFKLVLLGFVLELRWSGLELNCVFLELRLVNLVFEIEVLQSVWRLVLPIDSQL